MLMGYPYYGTGNTGTDVTATIMDPILRTAVTTVTIRGAKRSVKIMGISPSTDAPAWNIWHRVKVGNTEPDYRYINVFPSIDADAPGANLHTSTYQDLGGIIVNELETISIIIDDPGTANHAGVLWIEDGEPEGAIPSGRIVTLLCGGTNDAATTIAITGFDKDANKLENGYNYTLFKAQMMPEDKVVQAAFLQAGVSVATLPNIGTMVYPKEAITFTGEQWNAGQVAGYLQVQAQTKVRVILWLVETSSNRASPNAPPIAVAPSEMPGTVTLAQVTKTPAINTLSIQGRAGLTFMR
jgi:hypothetical protein